MEIDLSEKCKPLVWWEAIPYLMVPLVLAFIFIDGLDKKLATFVGINNPKILAFAGCGFVIVLLGLTLAALVRRWNDPGGCDPYP